MPTRSLFLLVLAGEALAVVGATIAGALVGKPGLHFREHMFVTYLSGFQLLATGWLAFRIYQARRPAQTGPLWRSAVALWPLMALGFVFLAADETLQVHERLQRLAQHVLGTGDSSLGSRFGNLIMLAYGVAGVAILVACRREVKGALALRPYLLGGFVVAVAMVALDAATEKPDFLLAITGSADAAQALKPWFGVGEDSAKIFAEGFFLAAFYAALQRVRSASASQPASSEATP